MEGGRWMEAWLARYEHWTTHPCFDPATRDELAALAANLPEIEDRFYCDLTFGTGGLRGLIGAGTNRINRYVVRQVTRGLAAHIGSFGEDALWRGVVIAHDSRRFSSEFAREAACVLAAAGVRAYLWKSLRPTPMLSFAVRELRAIAGIVITASHNPPGYNGYKVYWEDGGQVPPERAAAIQAQMQAVEIASVEPMDEPDARAKGLICPVPPEIDRAYRERLRELVAGGDPDHRASCRVLYTPLHGSGYLPVSRVLTEAGFRLAVVEQQALPDPDFPTLSVPNPEEAAVFELALGKAELERPDVIVATDPDADRLGVMARDGEGSYRLLTGNQVGALLADFLLGRLAEAGSLPPKGVVLKSIASSNMVARICEQYGVQLMETHTGFKFIGDKIREFTETGSHQFLFGFEESYGYLAGDFVRDKDGVMAALLAAEATAWHKAGGRTLYDALERLWAAHGYFEEAIRSVTLPGKDGLVRMAELMANLRKDPPAAFGPLKVAWTDDYLTGVSRNPRTRKERPLTLGKADVLHYRFADGGFVLVRPSGTEPKLKIYVSVVGQGKLEAVMKGAVKRLGLT